jgi:hypothetical protein
MQPVCHAACFGQEGRRANDLALLCHLNESRERERFARVGSMEQGRRTDFVQEVVLLGPPPAIRLA